MDKTEKALLSWSLHSNVERRKTMTQLQYKYIEYITGRVIRKASRKNVPGYGDKE